jgi:hypothetical protein
MEALNQYGMYTIECKIYLAREWWKLSTNTVHLSENFNLAFEMSHSIQRYMHA